jgi:hypothetical protein
MSWTDIKEDNRQKIESLLSAFDQFVTANHKGVDPQDRRIVSEWTTFKEIIDKSPGDTQSHNKHVSALRNKLLKEEVSKHLVKMGAADMERHINSKTIDIDKNKLLALCRDLKRQVLRNTKDPLHLLD